ncbi:NAD(P)H-hydrate dehydratase [Nocardioides sp. LHD-245]|uniref:NAD(P)H-hydrate dehydratase n=1 Tax=Nocardioides sp. LHD-245 TaxID=3051387 RepID=UPI0027DFDED7|nr:NAD(P)H-hydrate dehydratase [Nocardioides sp. LHD-245]
MLRAHTVEQVRAAEADLLARLPEGALMQRAAAGLGYAVLDLLGSAYGRRVLLLVGSGDNGGDALYAGALLARRGAQVEAWLLSATAHEGGLAALRAAGGRVGTPGRAAFDVVVDGIVGIGGRPGLRPEATRALELVAGIPVVAVDTPSGVDVDTGRVEGPHVTADLTVTFGTHKTCHLVDPAAQACGAVHLVDIGLDLPAAPVEALQAADVAALLPRPAADAHKYTRGVVGVRAGSATYPGAALLSVAGAACGLAGMVRYDGDPAALDLVRAAHPEVVGPGRVQAWVVGSGSDAGAEDAVRRSVADGVPLVIDADALAFAGLARGRPAVLTPHAGELARMLDVDRAEIEADCLEHARRAARTYDAVVLLKGRRTVVARPDGAARVTTTGTPWLATAGAGDVLGGLIGALLATGLTPYDAASVGSWLHGAAATLAARRGPIVAGDVAAALPALLARLTTP